MTERTYWEELIRKRPDLPLSLKSELDELAYSFSKEHRAPPEVRAIPWEKTRKKLERLEKTVADLERDLNFIDVDTFVALLRHQDDHQDVVKIRNKVEAASIALELLKTVIHFGQINHKKDRLKTQKDLNKELLKMLFTHANDAYRLHTGNDIDTSEKGPIPFWLKRFVIFTNKDLGYSQSQIGKIFKEWLRERDAPEIEPPELDSVYELGKRYLVVRGLFHDAADCDIQDDLTGTRVEHAEVLFENIALLERIEMSPVTDLIARNKAPA